MKNNFDFQRFLKVLRLSWQTQPVLPYAVLVAAVPLIYLSFMGDAFSAHVSLRNESPFLVFSAYFCGCGWLYAGMAYHELGMPGTAVRYLLVPASSLEKWLAKSLLALIVFPAITWLTFNFALKGFEMLSLRWFAFRYAPINWFSRDTVVVFFFFFLALPAAYASGLTWKRFGVLKGFIFVVVLFVILYKIMQSGFDQQLYNSGRGILLQEVNLPFWEMDCDAATQKSVGIFWLLAAYVPSLLMLAASYLFIREKEL
ncbi:MAG: hypothetical protein IT262_03920 [Saprospiraceae bacterium]|nr:hypothetical protein [Saprospiraceae bacterium]